MIPRLPIRSVVSRHLLAAPLTATITSSSFTAAAVAVSVPSSSSSSRSFHSSTSHHGANVPRVTLQPGLDRVTRWISPPTFSNQFKQFAKLVHPDLFGGSEQQQKVNQESLQQLNSFVASLKSREAGVTYPPKQKIQLVFYLKKRYGQSAYNEHVVYQGRSLLLRDSNHAKRLKTATRHLRTGEKMIHKYEQQKARENGELPSSDTKPIPSRGDVIEGEFHILPVRLTTNGRLCKHQLAKQFQSMFMRAGVEGSAMDFVWDPEYWRYVPRDPNAKVDVKKPEEEEQ